ncbi:hypothetical protein JYT74_00215 [Crocinitomix catalasitica]|nr:hypothetical protein [Crocinitomix catalasitica]
MKLRALSLTLLVFIAFIVAFSCKKEISQIDSGEYGYEKIEAAFSKSTYQMSTGISAHEGFRGCSWWGVMDFYSWTIDYRLTEGIESNGRVFYPIEKKWKVDFISRYCCEGTVSEWSKDMRWFRTKRLYRYDVKSKKAMIYMGMDDTRPEIIMDFDLAVGDSWLIDEKYDLEFIIDDIEIIKLNNVGYPVYRGHYSMGGLYSIRNSSAEDPVYLSPFNPNPFRMTEDFKAFENHNWSIFQVNDEHSQPVDWIPESKGAGYWDTYYSITHDFDASIDIKQIPTVYGYF